MVYILKLEKTGYKTVDTLVYLTPGPHTQWVNMPPEEVKKAEIQISVEKPTLTVGEEAKIASITIKNTSNETYTANLLVTRDSDNALIREQRAELDPEESFPTSVWYRCMQEVQVNFTAKAIDFETDEVLETKFFSIEQVKGVEFIDLDIMIKQIRIDLDVGEKATISETSVINIGSVTGHVKVDIVRIRDNAIIGSAEVDLAPGESHIFETEYTCMVEGTTEFAVNAYANGELKKSMAFPSGIIQNPEKPKDLSVKSISVPIQGTIGQPIDISAMIENTYLISLSDVLEFDVSGEVFDSRTVVIEPSVEKEFSTVWIPKEAGTFTVTATLKSYNSSKSGTIVVPSAEVEIPLWVWIAGGLGATVIGAFVLTRKKKRGKKKKGGK